MLCEDLSFGGSSFTKPTTSERQIYVCNEAKISKRILLVLRRGMSFDAYRSRTATYRCNTNNLALLS